MTGYKNGRPATSEGSARELAKELQEGCESSQEDLCVMLYAGYELLTEQAPDIQLAVLDWIGSRLLPGGRSSVITSAQIMRLLEKETGIEIPHNAMKDALDLAGYKPVNPYECLCYYFIADGSPAIRDALDGLISAYR